MVQFFQGETSSEILLVDRHHLAMAVLITSGDDAQCEEKDRQKERDWSNFDCVFQICITVYMCNGSTPNCEVVFMEW